MKIPGHLDVQIDEAKVLGYLLSESHPVGRFKARVFAALGFRPGTSRAFVEELRRIAAEGEVVATIEGPFGRKFVVPGELRGPSGAGAVLTVWLVEDEHERARLITVRPR